MTDRIDSSTLGSLWYDLDAHEVLLRLTVLDPVGANPTRRSTTKTEV